MIFPGIVQFKETHPPPRLVVTTPTRFSYVAEVQQEEVGKKLAEVQQEEVGKKTTIVPTPQATLSGLLFTLLLSLIIPHHTLSFIICIFVSVSIG